MRTDTAKRIMERKANARQAGEQTGVSGDGSRVDKNRCESNTTGDLEPQEPRLSLYPMPRPSRVLCAILRRYQWEFDEWQDRFGDNSTSTYIDCCSAILSLEDRGCNHDPA